MTCRACGAANVAGRKFCANCGARLEVVCANCGAANGPADRFCGECGTPLAAETASVAPVAGMAVPSSADGPLVAPDHGLPPTFQSPPAPLHVGSSAERRVVTVLFADLVGFTTLAEGRDAEAVRELLTRYFDLASEVIGRYGGVVEKFIGDAVMAIWGAPIAHEDDAERAVRAGLELVDGVHALDLGGQLEMRAGILTGEAAVTLGAVGQGMVAGDLVNTASRLQSVAPPGTILVGESTYLVTRDAVAYESAGDQLLRGKETPVRVWRPLRVVGLVRGAGRSDIVEPPFVGREMELRLIKDLLHGATRERRLRLVSVIGQPGVGKSRLAWELHKYIDGISEVISWHQGRSPAYGVGVTFWALGEMVRKRAGLAETDDADATRAGIADALERYVPDETERHWIEPRLLRLLGIDDGPAGDRDELFAAWRTFFERVSEQDTVVMVFEDIQWADTGLLDFIDHLAEWSRGRPILVVTLARPELLERHPEWGAGRRNFVSLSLEALQPADMRALLEGMVPGLPVATAEAILARADGIPLYAVETVRMLLHSGQLEAVGGAYRPVGETIRLEVPETLHALIAARLDSLEPADRSLLQDAAVLGQTFTIDALAAVCEIEPSSLEGRLRALERREMIVQELDPRSPERGQYGFVQAMIRDVAYGTLSRRDRRARHLAAARFFEGQGDDEIAGVLATHYRDAYLAMPEGEEGEAVAVQARLALRGAAERAAALHSHEQALAYLEQALSISPENADDPDLLERAGMAALAAGMADAADGHLERSIRRYRERDDRAGTARSLAHLGKNLVGSGRLEPAIELLSRALEEFPDLEFEPAMVTVASELARAYMLHEEPQKSLVLVEQTLVAAERLDMIVEIAEAMNTRALALQVVGRFRESTTTLRGVLWLTDRYSLTQSELRAYNNLSFMLLMADPREGVAVAVAGIERARQVGSRKGATFLASNGASAALRIGDWATATSLVETWLEDEQDTIAGVELRSTKAIIAACRGEPDDGWMDRYDPILTGSTDPQVPAVRRFTDGWAALAEGRLEDAGTAAMEAAGHATSYAVVAYPLALRAALWAGDLERAAMAVAAFEALAVHGDAVEATRSSMRAGIAALHGRSKDAMHGALDALERWRILGARFEFAMTVLDALATGGAGQAWLEPAVDEARAILQELGATRLLARIEATGAPASEPDHASDPVASARPA